MDKTSAIIQTALVALRAPSHGTDLLFSRKYDRRALLALQQGGRRGGQARAKRLTAEERRAIARKAALKRWREVRQA